MPGDFLDQLLIKAGLPVDYWSSTIRFSRYRSISFVED
jgi:AMMECR1 domain-containing protein